MQTPGDALSVVRLKCWMTNRLALGIVVLFTSMTLSSCLEFNRQVEPLFPLFIQSADLPSGWYYDQTDGGVGPRDNEREGIVSRYVVFRGTRDSDLLEVHVSQEIVRFPDAEQAAEGFARIAQQEVPMENWIQPEHLKYESQADQFLLVCLDLQSVFTEAESRYRETHWCRIIGRYDTVVSIIYANVFEDKWLTFEDFHRLLTLADAHLVGARDLDH